MTDLTAVTVHFTPRAMTALDQACAATGDSRTDTINRALVLYTLVVTQAQNGGGAVNLDMPGQNVTVVIT